MISCFQIKRKRNCRDRFFRNISGSRNTFFTQFTFFAGSFAPFGKFFLGNIHSTFSGVHPVVCFCVRMMDFVNSARTQCFSYCIMSFRTIPLQCGNKYSNINAVMFWISQTESDRLQAVMVSFCLNNGGEYEKESGNHRGRACGNNGGL